MRYITGGSAGMAFIKPCDRQNESQPASTSTSSPCQAHLPLVGRKLANDLSEHSMLTLVGGVLLAFQIYLDYWQCRRQRRHWYSSRLSRHHCDELWICLPGERISQALDCGDWDSITRRCWLGYGCALWRGVSTRAWKYRRPHTYFLIFDGI